VLDSHLRRPAPAGPVLACLLLAAGLRPAAAADLAGGFTLGGSLAVTSNYIYRGVSESNGHAAVQADLHAESGGGTFLGVWGSTRDNDLDPYTDFDLEIYLGHRFKLSNAWSAALSARGHYFVGGGPEGSTDYEQLAGSLTYLDRWTLSLAAIPNATHYWFDQRVGRSSAWVAETAGQWLLPAEGLFVTGGAGYYYASRTGPGIGAGGGYAYGDAGLAFEHRHWRLDIGYFVAQGKARKLVPYPVPADRVAGTLAWRF
jgi:uncharacterized protein (TIGR02001 family)